MQELYFHYFLIHWNLLFFIESLFFYDYSYKFVTFFKIVML